ncbi:MAG: YARHG domain-containing protein [Armatimonadetes bacterium]|nr:YARHG domain-containing protein [Armatimonadota bacterium]
MNSLRRATVALALVALTAGMTWAAQEMIINRVEVNGRLLVPLRGVMELAGATVDYYPATRGIEITLGSTLVSMFVNNHRAYINGQAYNLDVAPRIIDSSTYIPLRFASEALGMTVDYQGTRVTLTGGGQTIILYIEDVNQPPPPPPVAGEILPQSNDRYLTNADLAGLSNWQLTLARNEIYARHGRPFNNPNIRAYFQSTGWYRPNPAFSESWLSQTESRNASFIRDYQKALFGQPATRP